MFDIYLLAPLQYFIDLMIYILWIKPSLSSQHPKTYQQQISLTVIPLVKMNIIGGKRPLHLEHSTFHESEGLLSISVSPINDN